MLHTKLVIPTWKHICIYAKLSPGPYLPGSTHDTKLAYKYTPWPIAYTNMYGTLQIHHIYCIMTEYERFYLNDFHCNT
jgi:hypothetical protein